MTENLKELIKNLFCKTHQELNAKLLDLSKDDLIAVFNNLLTMYINDKNSSTIREFITVSLAGYSHSIKKLVLTALNKIHRNIINLWSKA